MKCFRRFGIIVILLVISLATSGCKGKKIEEPHLTIIANDQELKGIYYGNHYNETREDIEKRLKMVMEDSKLEDIPYVAINDTITIETDNFKTDEFKVFDYILNQTGEILYYELGQKSTIAVEYGKSTIVLPTNMAFSLSSNSEDYLPGRTLRCFVLRPEMNDSTFTFAFILRTDPN